MPNKNAIYFIVTSLLFSFSETFAATIGNIGDHEIRLYEKILATNKTYTSRAIATSINADSVKLNLYCQHDEKLCTFILYSKRKCTKESYVNFNLASQVGTKSVKTYCVDSIEGQAAYDLGFAGTRDLIKYISDSDWVTISPEESNDGLQNQFNFEGANKLAVAAVLGYHGHERNHKGNNAEYQKILRTMSNFPAYSSSSASVDCSTDLIKDKAITLINYAGSKFGNDQTKLYEIRLTGKLDGWILALLDFMKTNAVLDKSYPIKFETLRCAKSMLIYEADQFSFLTPNAVDYKIIFNKVKSDQKKLCKYFEGIEQLNC